MSNDRNCFMMSIEAVAVSAQRWLDGFLSRLDIFVQPPLTEFIKRDIFIRSNIEYPYLTHVASERFCSFQE